MACLGAFDALKYVILAQLYDIGAAHVELICCLLRGHHGHPRRPQVPVGGRPNTEDNRLTVIRVGGIRDEETAVWLSLSAPPDCAFVALVFQLSRPEEPRVGKGWGSTCSFGVSPVV